MATGGSKVSFGMRPVHLPGLLPQHFRNRHAVAVLAPGASGAGAPAGGDEVQGGDHHPDDEGVLRQCAAPVDPCPVAARSAGLYLVADGGTSSRPHHA